MRVSLLLVVMSATTLLAQEWRRYARRHLETLENGYHDCWLDRWTDRVLRYEVGRDVVNIQHCAIRCMGFTYFGMMDQAQCYCGDVLYMLGPGHRPRDGECGTPCRQRDYNDHLWICGAPDRISVYESERFLTYMEQFPDDPLTKVIYAKQQLQTIENGYYGCYRDGSPHRLLSHQIGRGVQNIQECAVRCLGFTYFGMEDEDQCFCGNQLELTRSRELVSDNECHTLCSRPDFNNTEWICGAPYRISVYMTELHYTYMEQFPDDPLWKLLYTRQYLETTENGYYGCWRDGSDNRLLSDEIGGEVGNIQDCAYSCLGYRLFGVKHQEECFCGNRLDMSGSRARVSDHDCDTFCRHPGFNNTEWICGAANRMSVYRTDQHFIYMEQFPDEPLWKLLYARQHLQTPTTGYLGCWQDSVDNRLLSDVEVFWRDNIQDCALECLGYRYFGMENQHECFCADQIDWSLSSQQVSDNECDRLCRIPGHYNNDWICGARNRISVYITEQHLMYMEPFTDGPLLETHWELSRWGNQ